MEVLNFKKKVKPRKDSEKSKKNNLESLNELFKGREKVLDAFKNEIFLLALIKGTGRPSDLAHVAKVYDCKKLKMLTPKQIHQRLPIVLHK